MNHYQVHYQLFVPATADGAAAAIHCSLFIQTTRRLVSAVFLTLPFKSANYSSVYLHIY